MKYESCEDGEITISLKRNELVAFATVSLNLAEQLVVFNYNNHTKLADDILRIMLYMADDILRIMLYINVNTINKTIDDIDYVLSVVKELGDSTGIVESLLRARACMEVLAKAEG